MTIDQLAASALTELERIRLKDTLERTDAEHLKRARHDIEQIRELARLQPSGSSMGVAIGGTDEERQALAEPPKHRIGKAKGKR